MRIDKKTGALTFLDKTGKCLLAEKAALPRQMEYSSVAEGWLYFDWPKKEKLYAKGVLDSKLEPMNQKARYISFGQKALRMPLVVSEYGYGIGLASEGTALACTIPMYGSYLYMEGKQLDYYFIYESVDFPLESCGLVPSVFPLRNFQPAEPPCLPFLPWQETLEAA